MAGSAFGVKFFDILLIKHIPVAVRHWFIRLYGDIFLNQFPTFVYCGNAAMSQHLYHGITKGSGIVRSGQNLASTDISRQLAHEPAFGTTAYDIYYRQSVTAQFFQFFDTVAVFKYKTGIDAENSLGQIRRFFPVGFPAE